MSKHTPGPWIGAGPSFGDPLPRYINEIVTVDENDDGFAETICRLPFDYLDAENEANALLIAAAPDLLDALQSLVNHLTDDDYEIARAAIAKATGETNA